MPKKTYSPSVVNYFNEKKEQRDEALQHLSERQERVKKYLGKNLTWDKKLLKMNFSFWTFDSIAKEALQKSLQEYISEKEKSSLVTKPRPVSFEFNGVKVYVDWSAFNSWEEIRLEWIDEYVNILWEDTQKTMSAQYTAEETISWQYIAEKKREKAEQQARKVQQEMLEKEKTLPDVEFVDRVIVQVDHFSQDEIKKYNIELADSRFIDDMCGMWFISWENLRKLGLEKNTDWYGRAIYTYAERRAKLMQDAITKDGKRLEDVAWGLSHDVDLEWITGFMYGAAVWILSKTWKYGEDLRKWHNKEYNHDWDGVVNPAILTVSTK